MSNFIKPCEKKLSNLLISLGFEVENINDVKTYKYKDSYYRFTFVEGIGGVVLEYAENLEDAKKNLYEDSDIFRTDMDQEQLLNHIENIIRKRYLL